MITCIQSLLNILSGTASRAITPVDQPRVWGTRLGRSNKISTLIHRLLANPDWSLPSRQSKVDKMVAILHSHLSALALKSDELYRPPILDTPVPTDHLGSRIHLILLAQAVRQLLAAMPVTSKRATDGADTTARQNSPVNAVGWGPPSGSAPISEEARRHLVAAAPAGRAERSAAA
ncbi:hypothetical protein ACFWNK_28325 [Streptomyces sp. NPDC058417]|uniref:hypothetical protein n=1 Tax=unclassified Streptomyces TaxID=2593676 RepID=UPI003654E5CE